MKDYIALPKPNGYESLHTTVLGMFDFPVEIQVRTQEMDEIANFGVAAHYAYSEQGQSISISAKQAKWMQKLQNIVKKYQEATDKENFKDELNIEILQRNIFVYTPKGDIIELPQGSTVLDFAFRVHTDVGLKFRNAFINGRIVPIDYKLKTGDIVSITTFKNKFTASRGWLEMLHTPSAKAKLGRFIRETEKDDVFKEIEELINKKLKQYNLPLLGTKNDLISKERKGEKYEQLLLRVRDKQLSPTRLIKDTYEEEILSDTLLTQGEQSAAKEPPASSSEKAPLNTQIVIDDDKEMEYVLCPLCKPKKGHKIIARTGKDGLKIHHVGCSALETLNYDKLLAAHRKGQKRQTYVLHVQLLVDDKPGMLLQIFKIIDFYGLNINNIYNEKHEDVKKKLVVLDIPFKNPSRMGYILKEISQNQKHISVYTKEIL